MSCDSVILQHIRGALLKWGQHNLRRYPWRETRDPYQILLAEILLHRTRADQVVPVYQRVLDLYPTVQALAQARLEDLSQLLRPLGLRWRVPLVLQMAQELVDKFGGEVPAEAEVLRRLPGVGHYIASATSCFAFNRPEPILDTNTLRVLGRLFGLEVRDSSRKSKRFRDIMKKVVDREHPRLFNLALLDLAALVCTPGSPFCHRCPLTEVCFHYRRNHADTDTKGTDRRDRP